MTQVDERRIAELGHDLLARVRSAAPWPLTRAWVEDRGMAWTMRDERFKAQLFRFVDALPGLRDDAAVVRHLGEYLGPVAGALPAPARWLLGRQGWPTRPLVAGAARFAAHRLAHKFIAGESVAGAARALGRLRRRRLAFTIDLLGETVLSEVEADGYADQYRALIGGLSDATVGWRADDLLDQGARVNVSIKLSALTSRWDPAAPVATSRAVRERLRPILRLARTRGAFVNVDMEHHAYKELVLTVLRDVLDEAEFRAWPDVGVAIQAYLRSCGDDLDRLATWARARGTPLWVRLVKGAYWDYETVIAAQNGWPVPVWTDKRATDAAFEAHTRFLFANRDALRPAIAGHNVRSIAHALAVAEAHGVAPADYEFQMLYGMAEPLKDAVAALGRRVRVYAPFGRLLPGMAYLVRRLLENTSNTSFVRAGFLEGAPEEHLLMPPIAGPERLRHVGADFVNEPLTDFSRAEARDALQGAISALRPRLPLPVAPHFPGAVGRGPRVEIRNPSRLSEVVAQVRQADAGEATAAAASAARAFPAWRDTPVAERARLLETTADLLASERMRLCAIIALETGKGWREADADVAEAVDFCRYYAREAIAVLAPRTRDVPGERNEYRREPRGVAAVIAPWNFPLAILTGMSAAALAAGNTVVLKPAEQSPAIAWELSDAFRRAGIPAGVVAFLPGVGEVVGPALLAHPAVTTVAFTGSRDVGLAIGRDAWLAAPRVGHVIRVIAEMGGKNAIIVDDDADLDEAVQGVVASAFGYQGQKCSACSRAVVLDAVHDAFVARLLDAVRSLVIGEADDPATQVGPVIDAEARDRILARIADARGEATLAYAGDVGEWGKRGTYVAPHVFTAVPPESRLAQEEIFGPVLAVLRARDLDQALAIANGTRYALTGGLYSRSPATIQRVRRDFHVGNLYINRKITGALVDRQPFGGFKLSGVGAKAGGPDYLLQFLDARVITENTLRHGFTGDET